MTKELDLELIVFALDDVGGIDELSWKVIKNLLIFSTSSKFLIMGAAHTTYGLNTRGSFWDVLSGSDHVRMMPLAPMTEEDIHKLVRKSRADLENQPDRTGIARTIYLLSEGIPFVAETLLKLYCSTTACGKDSTTSTSSSNVDEVKDVLLNRLDSLPTSTRLHLQCGAMLGLSFTLSDVLAVMEKYNSVTTFGDEEAKAAHLEVVCQSLEEAEKHGFLSSNRLGNGGIILYTFTHSLWKDVISKQILQEWKDRVQQLIDVVLKTSTNDCIPHHLHHEPNMCDVTPTSVKPLRAKPMRSV